MTVDEFYRQVRPRENLKVLKKGGRVLCRNYANATKKEQIGPMKILAMYVQLEAMECDDGYFTIPYICVYAGGENDIPILL